MQLKQPHELKALALRTAAGTRDLRASVRVASGAVIGGPSSPAPSTSAPRAAPTP